MTLQKTSPLDSEPGRACSPEELAQIRAQLEAEIERLRAELGHMATDLSDALDDTGGEAGEDDADVGAKAAGLDQEASMAGNVLRMLTQSEHALERIVDGSYGECESCGEAIDPRRLEAFPRATRCVGCKQRSERP